MVNGSDYRIGNSMVELFYLKQLHILDEYIHAIGPTACIKANSAKSAVAECFKISRHTCFKVLNLIMILNVNG